MPDNAVFYKAAYTATATIFTLYSLTLWLRLRRVNERLDALDAGPSDER